MDRRPSTAIPTPLVESALFSNQVDDLPPDQRIEISYLRAQAMAQLHKLTAHDLISLSPKFWAMHTSNMTTVDAAATILLTIQYNLAAGTIAPWVDKRPELRPIFEKIMNFEVSQVKAQFMLTEQAHGLDVINLETRVDMLDDGSFILNTPNDRAAKFMPPTSPLPCILMPKYAVVFARLFLPSWACLGSLRKSKNAKSAFQAAIWRVSIGGIAIGALAIPVVAVSAYIAGRYSLNRRVISPHTGESMPIIEFRTQQLPIFHALAQSFVMQAFMNGSTILKQFSDFTVDAAVRAGIAAACKTVMTMHVQESCTQLSDRIGAQGLFGHNQIINLQLEMRGASIAEGDTLVLCIRLAAELLLGKYALPPPIYPDCLAAKHEAGLFEDCRAELAQKIQGKHRSETFNRFILPRCKPLVEAIGLRFFYTEDGS
ncbi:acyl-CoA dehydrogenase NM domain-like protein [Mycena sanguinolenta]|nr:acyl-CoA dehydrogenase NM domain-like protein [Mycena sanguinolenta]